MDKTMKKSSIVTSATKLLLYSSFALFASPAFSNIACPKGSYETLIDYSPLPQFDNQRYYISRKITFQGKEYDCLRPEQLVRPLGDGGYTRAVEGGGYTLREKCGPFYAVSFNNTEHITMQANDGSWYNFRHHYDHNQPETGKVVDKCNSTNTYCNSYAVGSPKFYKLQSVRDVISVNIITAYLLKCSNPTF